MTCGFLSDPAGSGRPEPCRCLIVEDNAAAAEIMTIFFQRNGILSTSAENGQIGLQLFLDAPADYDVIFVDLQMPVMDGYEMARRIRESGRDTAITVPIVAMSGTNTGDVVSRGSFDCFLKKPFELNALLNVLDEIFSGRQYQSV